MLTIARSPQWLCLLWYAFAGFCLDPGVDPLLALYADGPTPEASAKAETWLPLAWDIELTDNGRVRDKFKIKQFVVYKSLDYWRVENHYTSGMLSVGLSDGSTVWNYSVIHGETRSVRKEDLRHKAIRDKKLAKVIALITTMSESGVVFLANPKAAPWKGDFGLVKELVDPLKYQGEEQVNGTDCIRYKLGSESTYFLLFWFGKRDGLLRRQVLQFHQGFGGRMEARVIHLEKRATVRPELFRFEPPAGIPITDMTDILIRDVEEASKENGGR